MNNDKKQLDSMLEANKISKSEYKRLNRAMEKSVTQEGALYSLINPFKKVAGVKALIVGVFFLLMISYLGVVGKLYFLGPLSLKVLPGSEAVSFSFFILLYQNLVGWGLLSLAFLLVAHLFQKKKVRSIDFFGTVLFAHYPYLLLSAFLCLLQFWVPSVIEVSSTQHPSFSLAVIALMLASFVAFIWQIAVYFFALKESSGLEGKTLVLSFIIVLILTEMVAYSLTSIFIN